MMSATRIDIVHEPTRTGKRFGYGIAVVINLVMLLIVLNILEWGWVPFLTDEFTAVVPWISLSLIVSIVVHLVYQFNDTPVVKSTGQILINLISVFVTYQVYLVFPFDFSSYDFNWALLTRIVLIVAMVGAGIGVLAEAVKLTVVGPENERR
jgi:hypothetical protein